MKTVYSINQGPVCITDAYTKEEAIAKATAHFQDQREEDGFIGDWEEEATLETYDPATGEEKEEKITLFGEAEEYHAP